MILRVGRTFKLMESFIISMGRRAIPPGIPATSSQELLGSWALARPMRTPSARWSILAVPPDRQDLPALRKLLEEVLPCSGLRVDRRSAVEEPLMRTSCFCTIKTAVILMYPRFTTIDLVGRPSL